MEEPVEPGEFGGPAPLTPLATGCLLVATPLLDDPNFRRSVVLILEHDEDEATLGVVINRPSEVSVDQVLPGWAGLVTGPPVLFQGGPVSLDSAVAVGRVAGGTGPAGWRALGGAGRVGLVDLDAQPALLEGELLQLRVFAGYAGWSQGQLRSEVDDGAWYIVDAEPGDAFTGDPGHLWRAVLRRQGGDLALVATFPDDPTMN